MSDGGTGAAPEGYGAVAGATLAGLALVYAQERAALLRFVRARCGEAAEAEDIVQEMWIRLQTHGTGPVGNGRGYLFSMANNMVLDRARERRRRAARERNWSEAVQGPATEPAAAPGPAAEDALIEQEELRQLAAAVASLPHRARQAFSMHKVEGCSHAEVAARLGISRSGVEKHIALAMRHLRGALLGGIDG